MSKTIEVDGAKLSVVQGDITAQEVDAVVNAANSSLLGGGGVDGAIHRAGGPAILEACQKIRAERGSLPTGEAVATTGGELPARMVIHTVGPVYQDGAHSENIALEQAYTSSLQIAADESLRTVAFPAISCGAYRFPHEEAALIALNTIVRFVRENPGTLDEVRLVLFDDDIYQTFLETLDEVEQTMIG